MIKGIVVTVLFVYVVGFGAIFALQTQLPVTVGLAVMRSVLWPLWVTTGRPQGVRLESDCVQKDCG